MTVFENKVTIYNSVEITDKVLIDPKNLSEEDFRTRLENSLSTWKENGHNGAYLELSGTASKLIPVAIDCGFKFHHAHDNYVMMTTWLDEENESSIPPGPIYHLGVGGMVVRNISNPGSEKFSDYEVLVIKEKHGPAANIEDFWKIPGGLVDMNEALEVGAVREVLEETGVKVNFEKVCGFRESHNGVHSMTRKNSTDIYFVCVMSLVNDDEREIIIQESEIADACWKNLDEWLNSSIYKNKRDPFAKLMRNAAEVAIGLRPGIEKITSGGRRTMKQTVFLSSKL